MEELERAGAYRVYEDPADLLKHLDEVGGRRCYTKSMAAELTRELSAAASDSERSNDSFEIVLELDQPGIDPGGNTSERIAKQKSSFESCAEPVKAAVIQAGGSIEGEAWINCTIRARVPAKALPRLSELNGVRKIDVPHRITREA